MIETAITIAIIYYFFTGELCGEGPRNFVLKFIGATIFATLVLAILF